MRALIYERFGINLTEQKRSLLVSRLQSLLKRSDFASFGQYYQHLANEPGEQALGALVDHITTNHTFFNREKAHFEYFSKVALPQVAERLRQLGRRDLRIWCAGCSSGEEPYMLLMLMLEYFGSEYKQWDAGILATDISRRALDKAERGIYNEEQVAAVPAELRNKYFRRTPDKNWEIAAQVRQEATFRRFNLMNAAFPFKRPFQIIFCRNVMIYFDQKTRDGLTTRFHQCLEPKGYFFIGHSESLSRDLGMFNYQQPAVYQKL